MQEWQSASPAKGEQNQKGLDPRPHMDTEVDLFVNDLSVERGLSANTIAAYSADLDHFQNYVRESGAAPFGEKFPGRA